MPFTEAQWFVPAVAGLGGRRENRTIYRGEIRQIIMREHNFSADIIDELIERAEDNNILEATGEERDDYMGKQYRVTPYGYQQAGYL